MADALPDDETPDAAAVAAAAGARQQLVEIGFRVCEPHDALECRECWPPPAHAETKAERSARLRWEADHVEGPEAPEQPAPEPVPTYQIGEVLGGQVVTLIPLHELKPPTIADDLPGDESEMMSRATAWIMLGSAGYQIARAVPLLIRCWKVLRATR